VAKKDETPSAQSEAPEAQVDEATSPEVPLAEAPALKLHAVTYETTAPETAPLEEEAVTDEASAAESPTKWLCPKDGWAMEPMGRRGRGGAWRCPTCRGVFIDVEAMRRGRGARPLMWAPGPVWAPVVVSVAVSVLLTVLVRWLKSRPKS
jgi:hypothetical protein